MNRPTLTCTLYPIKYCATQGMKCILFHDFIKKHSSVHEQPQYTWHCTCIHVRCMYVSLSLSLSLSLPPSLQVVPVVLHEGHEGLHYPEQVHQLVLLPIPATVRDGDMWSAHVHVYTQGSERNQLRYMYNVHVHVLYMCMGWWCIGFSQSSNTI